MIKHKYTLLLMATLLLACTSMAQSPWKEHGKLQAKGHYLIHEDGHPFFYLGDTNWEFFMRSRREDALKLIKNRKDKGFTVMQAVLTGAYLKNEPIVKGKDAKSNIYGDQPFMGLDVTQPKTTKGNDPEKPVQYDFWDHIDYVLTVAEQHGIYMGILPGWDGLYNLGIINKTNARQYGKWLGKRYRKQPNIIWILGGDTRSNTEDKTMAFKEMAAGIKEGDRGNHLITFHPIGRSSSSQWLHTEPWLDFNMIQSGHSAYDLPNYNRIKQSYDLNPVKPCMDAEPRYEDHSVNWNPENGWFNDFDVRQAAYWSLFSGSFGHTYGTRGVWQMYSPETPKRGPLNNFWYEAMDLPGGADMKHVKDLMLSRDVLSRVPDQSLVLDSYSGADHIRATRGDGYAFIYSPTGKTFTVDASKLEAKGAINAWWYNPKDGICYNENSIALHKPFKNIENVGEKVEFDPPGEPQRGNDWVLILDDASKKYTSPEIINLSIE